MTLRRRLLITMLATMAALVAVVSLAQVIVLHSYLLSRSTTHLQQISGSANPQGAPGGAPPPQPSPPDQVVNRIAGNGAAAEILAPDGSVIASAQFSGADTSTSFSVPSSVSALTSGQNGAITEMSSNGRHLLVMTSRIQRPQGATLVVAIDLTDDDSTVNTVVLVMVLGAAIALILASALLIPLLRGALNPLRRMATTADALSDGDLHRRVGGHVSNDEIGRLGVAFDRMADRVQALVGELRERESTMRRFVEDASHELRTPITGIRGSSQVLERGGLTETEMNESLHHIANESIRLSQLVDDLLTLSRIDGDGPPPPAADVDFAALAAANHPRWKGLARGHEVAVVADHVVVRVHEDSLVRAIDNLVTNAAKYSGDHGAIELRFTSDGPNAIVDVRDHGPGIPAADRERVFDRFYRSESARSRSTGGTGLGLAIVRAIAIGNGGDARIIDADGAGACVRITLPLRRQ